MCLVYSELEIINKLSTIYFRIGLLMMGNHFNNLHVESTIYNGQFGLDIDHSFVLEKNILKTPHSLFTYYFV